MTTQKTATSTYSSNYKKLYQEQYASELLKELGLKNANEVPELEKIIIGVGLGQAKEDKRVNEAAVNTIRKVTGQQPIETIARKSIAAFKLREGSKVGLKVSLRGNRMYEFMERLITLVLPRLRDFHGVSATSFDKQGNYSIGLKDQTVFPELSFEETTTLHGMQINFVIKKTKNAEQSMALLKKFGMPFEAERKV
jgi:large subunit ribosomal protein L5